MKCYLKLELYQMKYCLTKFPTLIIKSCSTIHTTALSMKSKVHSTYISTWAFRLFVTWVREDNYWTHIDQQCKKKHTCNNSILTRLLTKLVFGTLKKMALFTHPHPNELRKVTLLLLVSIFAKWLWRGVWWC